IGSVGPTAEGDVGTPGDRGLAGEADAVLAPVPRVRGGAGSVIAVPRQVRGECVRAVGCMCAQVCLLGSSNVAVHHKTRIFRWSPNNRGGMMSHGSQRGSRVRTRRGGDR